MSVGFFWEEMSKLELVHFFLLVIQASCIVLHVCTYGLEWLIWGFIVYNGSVTWHQMWTYSSSTGFWAICHIGYDVLTWFFNHIPGLSIIHFILCRMWWNETILFSLNTSRNLKRFGMLGGKFHSKKIVWNIGLSWNNFEYMRVMMLYCIYLTIL